MLRSGVDYSTLSVQGRFIAYGLQIREIFEYNFKRWLSDRLIDLIAVSGLSQMDQANSKQYITKVQEAENAVFELIDPFKKYRARAAQDTAKDDKARQAFIDKLSEQHPNGFGSLAEIKKSLGDLAKTMREMQGKS